MSWLDDFIKEIAPGAQKAQKDSGFLASVTIAQAILEGRSSSGKGLSTLAGQYHNIFGIKGAGVALPTTEVVNGKTVPIVANFRTYDSYDAAIADRTRVLMNSKRADGTYRYRDLSGVTDPYQFAQGLQAGGYATDPNYANKINSIVKQYNLAQYDTPGGGVTVAAGSKPERDKTWLDYWNEMLNSFKTGNFRTALPGGTDASVAEGSANPSSSKGGDDPTRIYLTHGNAFFPELSFSKPVLLQVGLFVAGAVLLFVFLKGQMGSGQTVVIEKEGASG